MKFRLSLFSFLLFFSLAGIGQVSLPYSINHAILPADSAKISPDQAIGSMVPNYFSNCGLPEREIVPDFVLYDTAGVPCQLSILLAEGKPVLLIAISLTCPQARKSTNNLLSDISKTYNDSVNIRLIYVIDAHPKAPDLCPYSGEIYTTVNNFRDSILLLQPKTYSERKGFAKDFIQRLNPGVPVLIDSPDNIFWKTFGPAPNNAYLITPTGMIYKKYGWFENPNVNIPEDISNLLASPSLMKTDVSKNAWIVESKTTGDISLFVSGGIHYEISIVDSAGKIVFNNPKVVSEELNLQKLKISPGQYSIVIKTSIGLSYCIPYKRQ